MEDQNGASRYPVEVSQSGLDAENPSQEIIDPILPTWRVVLLTISLCIGLFLSLLDTTIVATAQYTIGVDLNSLSSVTWVPLAYTLSYLGCTVIFARIADIVGRRNAYASAFVIFFASSLGCGFAQSLTQLIACRAIQGVGGSGLYALAFVILLEITPEKFVRWIHTLTGTVIATAGVLGPVLGGLLTQYTTWRWVFWINPIIGIIPLVFLVVAWPKRNQIREIQRRSIKQLDIIASILIIAASVLVLFPLEKAGLDSLEGNVWGKPIFIAPLITGCICWALLLGWEAIVARFWEGKITPMFPFGLLKKRVYMGYVFSMLLAGFPYFVIIYSLPLRLEVVNGMSPLMAGLTLLPMLGAVAVGSAIGGAVNGRKDRTCPTLLVGCLFMLMGTALLSTLKNTFQIEPKLYGFQVLFGLGFGLAGSVISLGVSLECEVCDSTVAQGMIAQARILGGSIGIASSTAILGVTEGRDLVGLVTPAQLANLQSSARVMTAPQLHAVRQVYSDAFAETLKVSTIVLAVCVLVTLVTFRRSPMIVLDRRRQQIIYEQERLRSIKEGRQGQIAR